MKMFLAIFGTFAVNVLANPCVEFNMKYEVCYESWLPKEAIKHLTDALDQSEIRTNLNLRKETIRDSTKFIFETKNSGAIEGVSELPSELRGEGMIELLGQSYGPYMAIASTFYFGDLQSKAKIPKDSLGEIISHSQFRFNLMTDKGKLKRSYDITKYTIYFMVELAKEIKGSGPEEDESEEE